MKCNQIHKKFYPYHLGDLSAQEKEDMDKHLANCPDCLALYQKYAQTISYLNDKETLPEHPFYYTRLKQRMENRKMAPKSRWEHVFAKKVLQPVIYLGSLFLAVYIGILIGSGTGYQSNLANNEPLDEDYIEAFAEYQYMNDFEIESIENVLASGEGEDREENK